MAGRRNANAATWAAEKRSPSGRAGARARGADSPSRSSEPLRGRLQRYFILESSASAAMKPNGIQFGPVMIFWKSVFASSFRPL